MTTYYFKPEGSDTPVPVEPEVWKWTASYNDGTSLHQFDDRDMSVHQFREIDQDRLVSFTMSSDTAKPITYLFQPGMKLIHFYRNIRLNVGEPNEVFIRLFCFGYQTSDATVITVILPDNSIAIVDDVDKIKFN